MTIYSTDTALQSEKKDLIDDGVTVEVVCPEKKSLTTDLQDVPLDTEYTSVYNDPVVPIRRQSRPQQKRIWVQLCLFIGMLTGLTISILASLYLYKSMNVSHLRYRGRCGVGILDMTKYNNTAQALAYTDMLEEDVDIDGNRETISVPKTGDYAGANITHDFDQNVTAIMDLEKELCYLLPILYYTLVPTTQSFYRTLDSNDDGVLDYVPEQVIVYTICDSDECFQGSLTDLSYLCGDYTPMYAEPMPEAPTTAPTTTTESSSEWADADQAVYEAITAMRTLKRMFRAYAGGNAAVSYHLYK